mgnify:CR=1 FL=1
MSAHYFKNFFVMYNKVNGRSDSRSHPHVVVGSNSNGKFVSFNLTSSPKIEGKELVEMNKNPERSFLVTDDVYFLDKGSYSYPTHGYWKVDPSDRKKILVALKKHKRIFK